VATLLKHLRLRGILSHPRRWMQLLTAVGHRLPRLFTDIRQRNVECFQQIPGAGQDTQLGNLIIDTCLCQLVFGREHLVLGIVARSIVHSDEYVNTDQNEMDDQNARQAPYLLVQGRKAQPAQPV